MGKCIMLLECDRGGGGRRIKEGNKKEE